MDVADVFYDNLWLFISAPPCIMHAITREPAWFLRSQRFPALRCADRTLFSVYQSALKPRDYWGCAVLRMSQRMNQ